ncbi:MAG: hypothetical protein VKP62_09710 [Candidatus Sericytochromatia bacterium]|nr:hypothetical protein [Candidatus Sericytochromatia bacterium]
MSSNFHYGVLAGFRAIDAMQQNLVQNMQGLLLPGYNRRRLHIGSTGGTTRGAAAEATQQAGSQGAFSRGGDTLALQGTSLNFEQGTIDPADNPASLAILGPGFFMVAENDRPGARVHLTRNGSFRYDGQGRLVNGDGLFVIGGSGRVALDANGRTIGPPPLIRNPGNGSVDLTTVSLATVPDASQLGNSGFGTTTYAVTPLSGPISAFPNGRQPNVGFVQPRSIETPNRVGWLTIHQAESFTATQTYKIFKDMLTEFNKTVDDTVNLIR